MPTGFAVLGAISASWGFVKDIVKFLKDVKSAKAEITDVLLRFDNDSQLLGTLHTFFTDERLNALGEDNLSHLTRIFSYLLPVTQKAYTKALKYHSIKTGDKILWAAWAKDLDSSEKKIFGWIERLQTCFVWFPKLVKSQLSSEGVSVLPQMGTLAVQQEMERTVARLGELEARQVKAVNGDFKLAPNRARAINMTSRTQLVKVGSVERLVEYRRIPARMASDVDYQDETELEVAKLVSLFSCAPPAAMFVLRPISYFDNFDSEGRPVPTIPFGVVYELPNRFGTPKRLSALWSTDNNAKPRHPLNERFGLARQVTTAVLFMHSVDWFHKGIQASSIWLAHPSAAPPSKSFPHSLGVAFLAGFDYTRRVAAQSTGDEAGESWKKAIYQHPERTRAEEQNGQSAVPFRAEHDIYSLGVVLVEIGRWKLLSTYEDMFKTANPEERKKAVEKLALSLAVTLGEKYTAIALRCIRVLDDSTAPLPPRGSFIRQVVADLDGLFLAVGISNF